MEIPDMFPEHAELTLSVQQAGALLAAVFGALDHEVALAWRDGNVVFASVWMREALGNGLGTVFRALVTDRSRGMREILVLGGAEPVRLRAWDLPDVPGLRQGLVLVAADPAVPAPAAVDDLRARFGLTAREAIVAGMLAERLTNAEIASALGISAHTARHHTETVMAKMGLRSRRQVQDAARGTPCGGGTAASHSAASP